MFRCHACNPGKLLRFGRSGGRVVTAGLPRWTRRGPLLVHFGPHSASECGPAQPVKFQQVTYYSTRLVQVAQLKRHQWRSKLRRISERMWSRRIIREPTKRFGPRTIADRAGQGMAVVLAKPCVCGRKRCENSTDGSMRTYDICATEQTGGRSLPATSRRCRPRVMRRRPRGRRRSVDRGTRRPAIELRNHLNRRADPVW
jgi:hypothetical protein